MSDRLYRSSLPTVRYSQALGGQLCLGVEILPSGQTVRPLSHRSFGAVKVLTDQGRSLLAVGVSAVKGKFTRGELVSCVDGNGIEIARGLVNYNSDEADRIKGQSTESISSILGYREDDELIHRDNLVVSP